MLHNILERLIKRSAPKPRNPEATLWLLEENLRLSTEIKELKRLLRIEIEKNRD